MMRQQSSRFVCVPIGFALTLKEELGWHFQMLSLILIVANFLHLHFV